MDREIEGLYPFVSGLLLHLCWFFFFFFFPVLPYAISHLSHQRFTPACMERNRSYATQRLARLFRDNQSREHGLYICLFL